MKNTGGTNLQHIVEIAPKMNSALRTLVDQDGLAGRGGEEIEGGSAGVCVHANVRVGVTAGEDRKSVV